MGQTDRSIERSIRDADDVVACAWFGDQFGFAVTERGFCGRTSQVGVLGEWTSRRLCSSGVTVI